MNKDVIYIEPEDDITDIITKIENSKQKIVALVPPKKAGVFRSVVNMKLINKAAMSSSKTVVLVTTDPSIIKIAATTRMPVTKDLKSAPLIPKPSVDDDGFSDTSNEEVHEQEESVQQKESSTEAEEENTLDEEVTEKENEDGDDKMNDRETLEDSTEEKTEKKFEIKKRDKSNTKNKFIGWIKEHKKTVIFGSIATLALILVLVWAFAIAPAATVTVGIKTDLNNFSETVTFTTKLEDESADEGKFYLEERKTETVNKVEFEATGSKNIGEKAKGDVVVYASINYKGGLVVVNAGDTFTNNGLSFVADSGARMAFDGDDTSVCANEDVSMKEFREQGCRIYARVNVTAAQSGVAYNIAATDSGWSTSAQVGVYSDKAMSGGTDEIITVVSQSDIDKAKGEIATADEKENKDKLVDGLPDNLMSIDSSFAQTTGDAVSAPAVGEKVEPNTKPTLTATTTAKIYVIDKTKIEEFIREKAKLGDDQKIYEIKSPFIENFTQTDGGYSGKLKTSYAIGPKITENDVIEIIKGKGLGEAQHDLRDINGVVSVTIDPSYPWVTSIPSDPNKITVILEIKE